MHENIIQAPSQAFMKLAQANMDLLTRFSTSPEVTAQVNANASLMFQQASESARRLMQSSAFAHTMQGLVKNYTEFFAELGHSGMVMLSQGQAEMTRQMQDANSSLVEVADTRGRRQRPSA